MWIFTLQSLFREYGRQFIRHVALPHPVRTARAVVRSGAFDFSGDVAEIPILSRTLTGRHGGRPSSCEDMDVCEPFGGSGSVPANKERIFRQNQITGDDTVCRFAGGRAIVGVGFCLKPMNPACMSGRFNHECRYLEHLLPAGAPDIPACCRQCAIRELGIMALKAGAAFYIMTSARDILFDVFKPALDEGRFASGLFALCRYSMKPFAVGMLVSGIQGRLFAFERGDCRDYKTWLQADRGIKDERTEISNTNRGIMEELLASAAKKARPGVRFERRGNVLYPATGPVN